MEGLLYFEPAGFFAVLSYVALGLYVLWFEWARDKRMSEPEDVIHLLIDEAEIIEEVKKAA